MKMFFWGFGVIQLFIGILPSSFTATWMGISHDAGSVVDAITILIGIVALGIGCILHKLDMARRDKND